MITLPRITIDRSRAGRALRDLVTIALAALPYLAGLLIGLLVTIAGWVWLVVLWVVGALLAGYDAGRRRSR